MHAHDVHLFAGGNAAEMLRELGGVEIESFEPGRRLARRLLARVTTDRRLLQDLRPDVVVTDGDAPSLLAATSARIPSIAVGHGLLLAHCRLPISVPFHQRAYAALNAGSSSLLARRVIAVHFGMLEPFDPRAVVARPDPRPDLSEGDCVRGDAIVVYAGQADLSLYVRALHGRGHRLVVFGRAENLPEGLVAEAPHVGRFAAALRECRGIVSTAGCALVSEAMALRRPLLLLAPEHMIEQQINARLAEHEGCAIAAAAEQVDVPAIERFEELLAHGVSARQPPTPTVTEAMLACLRELEPAGGPCETKATAARRS